jgi:hypothetical protein
MSLKYIGKIPADYITEDNIKWLVIKPQVHHNNIVGFYMFLHEDIDKPCKWDNWYNTLEGAFKAGEDYGVAKENWEVLHEN